VSQNNGAAVVLAAVILGASIVAGSLLVRNAVVRTADQVDALRLTLASAAKTEPVREAGGREPIDRNRRYPVSTKGAPVRGNPDAKVAVVEFSDFQCPYCASSVETLQQIQQAYGDKVRIVFKHLPLPMHPMARPAALASEAAFRQGKFWEMHDRIFAHRDQLSPESFRGYAQEIGLDMARYDRDLADAGLAKRIDEDSAEARKLGITGTPAFFVNGRYLPGAVPFESIQSLLDEDLGKT
jgi:protein-disulfide isomerase